MTQFKWRLCFASVFLYLAIMSFVVAHDLITVIYGLGV
jgi:hypothetical protein